MKPRMWSASALIALAGLLAAFGCGKAPTGEEPQARVVDVINDVEADPMAQDEWEDAQEDMVIYLEGQVWAKEASTSRVQVEEALVRVAPNSVFTFGQPDGDTLQVSLEEEGQLWITVEGLEPGETFEVEMPGVVAAVRGTSLSARVEPDGTAIVSTQAGMVTVHAATQVVTVTEGLSTLVPPGGVPSEPEPMSPEEQIRWGMATGAHLDVVLPVVGDAHRLDYPGYVLNRDWAPGGDVFGCAGYDPDTASFGTVFYDMEASEVYTTALPSYASAIFFDPAGGRLAYQSYEGPDEIWLCTAGMDGATEDCFGGGANYGWPLWSPQGEWVVFYSDKDLADGGYHLYRARPDGSEMTQLTFGADAYNIRQSWSPDGSRIAYVRTSDYNGAGEVRVMGADGSDPRLVFPGIYGDGYNHVPWSPDGNWLAVPADTGGLWLVDPSSAEAQLVPGTEDWECSTPVWAPTDVGWPLFFVGRDPTTGQSGMWYVSGPDRTPSYFGDFTWGPVWAPDGTALAFGQAETDAGGPHTSLFLFRAVPGFWQ